MPTKDPAGPPDDLTPAFKTTYRTVRASMKSQGTWELVDQHLLALFVRALQRSEIARMLLAEGLVVTGSKGNPIPNPALRIEEGASREARECGDRLLLSPRARKQFELEARKAGGKFGAFD